MLSLFVLLAAFGVLSVQAHTCIHDTPKIQEEIRSSMRKQIAPQKYHPKFHPLAAPAPIRIVTSTLDLDDTTKFCTAAGQTRPDFAGGTVTCTAEDAFTAEKKSILLTNVLPAALARLTEALNVVSPVAGNLIVPSAACPRHTIPASHTATGVPNADFVLYVSAGPTTGTTLAWAGGCSEDGTGRTVVGRANFGPAHISWSASTPLVNQDQVDTAIHELLHALGFSSTHFQRMGATRQISIRGKTTTILTTTNVVAKYREYLGCTTLEGPEIEDEGGTGSAGSHWDRRVLRDELMAASAGNRLSEMTLAFLQDTGFYTANYATKDSMTFGRGAGCGFATEKCNTAAGGAGTWFCFEQDSAFTACTIDRKYIGYCAIDDYDAALPAYFRYFDDPFRGGPLFGDGCPWIVGYDNRKCDDGSITVGAADQALGYYFGDGGRCWETAGIIADGFSSGRTGTNRCLQSQCVSGRPQFRINGSNWITCMSAGQVISDLPGFRGSVTCPDPTEFCANPGLPVYDSTVAPPATNAPEQQSSPTITGTLQFSGSGWQDLLNDISVTIAMQNVLRQNMASILEMLLEDVQMNDVFVPTSGTGLTVNFGLVTFRWTPGGVEDTFKAIADGGGTRGFEELISFYVARENITDTTLLVSAVTAANRAFCSDPMAANEDFCLIVLGGIVVGLILLCCLCYYCYQCCCKSDDLKDEETVPTPQVIPVVPRKAAPKTIHPLPKAGLPRVTAPPPKVVPQQMTPRPGLGKAPNPLAVVPQPQSLRKPNQGPAKRPAKDNFW